MESLGRVIDVLFYEGYFSFHDLYLLSLTCVGFGPTYKKMIPTFIRSLETDRQSRISFVQDNEYNQITVKQYDVTSLFLKRIQVPKGCIRPVNAYSFYYTGTNTETLISKGKLNLTLPSLVGKKLRVVIPQNTRKENLFHYLRLQRKAISSRLTEKLFIKVYDKVVSSYLEGSPIRKVLKTKRIHSVIKRQYSL